MPSRALVTATLILFAAATQAQNPTAPPSTNDPAPANPFRVTTAALPIGPEESRQAFVVTTLSNRFTFLPPANWRSRILPEEREVRLGPPETQVVLSLKFTEDPSPNSPTPSAESARQTLLSRYPGATIKEEFPTRGLGSPGYGFDLEWRNPSGARQVARFALLPFPGGHLEAVLTAPPPDITSYYVSLSQLLGSFRRSGPTGPLEFKPVNPE